MFGLVASTARWRKFFLAIKGNLEIELDTYYDYLHYLTEDQMIEILLLLIRYKNCNAIKDVCNYIGRDSFSSSMMKRVFEACEYAHCSNVTEAIAGTLELDQYNSAYLCELYTPCLIDWVLHSPSTKEALLYCEKFRNKVLSDGTKEQIKTYLDRNPKDTRYFIRLYTILGYAVTLPGSLMFELVLSRILAESFIQDDVYLNWSMSIRSSSNVRSIASLLKLKSKGEIKDVRIDLSNLFIETDDNLTFFFNLLILGVDIKDIKDIDRLCLESSNRVAEGEQVIDPDLVAECERIKGTIKKVTSIHAEVMEVFHSTLPADLIDLIIDYLL
jgi:hypothetical protein